MSDTPDIRFKGFNKRWEQRKVGKVIKTLPFKNYLAEPQPNGRYEIIQQGNDPIVGFANGKPFKDYCDVVLFGDHTLSLYRPSAPFFVATDGIRIISSINGLDGNYLLYLLEKYKPKSEGYKRYFSILANCNCCITDDVSEQRQIGAFFCGLDNLITLHHRKCDELTKLKKYMLQKMFPKNGEQFPEIRFNEFSDLWEQSKLGELVQFSKGIGYSKGDLKESGTPIILYGRLYTKYETVITDVDTFVDTKTGSVYSHGGEVIVPASGETAEDISIASVIEKSGVLLGGDLNIITPPNDMDSAFLAISISNGKPHNDMTKMAQGKSVVHLHNTDLEKIDLLYPSYQEQMQISNYFRQIDTLITLHQHRCDELKDFKKFMLQNMFPKKG